MNILDSFLDYQTLILLIPLDHLYRSMLNSLILLKHYRILLTLKEQPGLEKKVIISKIPCYMTINFLIIAFIINALNVPVILVGRNLIIMHLDPLILETFG